MKTGKSFNYRERQNNWDKRDISVSFCSLMRPLCFQVTTQVWVLCVCVCVCTNDTRSHAFFLYFLNGSGFWCSFVIFVFLFDFYVCACLRHIGAIYVCVFTAGFSFSFAAMSLPFVFLSLWSLVYVVVVFFVFLTKQSLRSDDCSVFTFTWNRC